MGLSALRRVLRIEELIAVVGRLIKDADSLWRG